MRRRQNNDNGRDDGVSGEGDETEAIHDHGGKLPVHHHFIQLVFASHLVGDEAELPQDALEFPRIVKAERGVRRDNGAPFLVGPAHEARVASVVRGRARAHGLDLADVVVDVQDVGQERLRGTLLQLKLPHLVVHHDGLAGDLLTWPVHA